MSSSLWWIQFPKTLIFPCKLKFYYWQPVPSSSPWNDRFTLYLLRKCLPVPKSREPYFTCGFLLKVKMIFHEKVASSAHTQTPLQIFSLYTNTILYATEVLYAYFPFHHVENLEDMYVQVKINNFYYFFKDILQWNWHFKKPDQDILVTNSSHSWSLLWPLEFCIRIEPTSPILYRTGFNTES